MKKHFIATLGVGSYGLTQYRTFEKDGDRTYETRFIQDALLQFLDFENIDRITIFVTDKAKTKNWDDTEQPGLESILKNHYPKCKIECLRIPDGNSEQEIWQIFNTIFQSIDQGDELYFDVTHGFRSLPILILAILQYSKILKDTKIKGVYYGVFDRDTEVNPAIDLTPFYELLSWTDAANSFIRYGHGEQIYELCQESDNPAIKPYGEIVHLTNALDASLGRTKFSPNDTVNSIHGAWSKFKQAVSQNEMNDDSVLNPLFQKIREKTEPFSSENDVQTGWAAVEWALENNMVQQGYTALKENILTFLSQYYDINSSKTANLINRYDQFKELTVQEAKKEARAIDSSNRAKKESSSVVNYRNKLDDILSFIDRLEKANSTDERMKILQCFLVSEDKNDQAYKDTYNDKIKGKVKEEKLFSEIPNDLVHLYRETADIRNNLNHYGYSRKPAFSEECLTQLSENEQDDLYRKYLKTLEINYKKIRNICDNYDELKLKRKKNDSQ